MSASGRKPAVKVVSFVAVECLLFEKAAVCMAHGAA